MKDFIGSVNAMKNLGVSTNDITDVIITHAHHDHINSFDEEFTVCDRVKVVKIGGHYVGSCIVEICDNIIAVGDECYLRECIDESIPT